MTEEALIRRVLEGMTHEPTPGALDRIQLAVEAVVGGPTGGPSSTQVERPRRGRARLALRVGAALAAVAAAAIVLFGLDEPRREVAGTPAYAAEWIRIAENNPRLLVTAPGWEVTRADELRHDEGETEFANGSANLAVHWYPIESYHFFFNDRAHDTDQSQIQLLGRTATLFDTGYGSYSVMFRPGGDTFVEITSDDDRTMGRQEFEDLLETVEPVDVNTWLAALPASVVQPTDRAATVDGMLKGVPVPPGLDLSELKQSATVRDRFQLGALLTGAVTCEWLHQRMSGLQAGDTAKVRQAEDALATARQWPILLEMRTEGGWAQEIWDWAADGRGSSGFGPNSTENPTSALGCPREDWRGVPPVDPSIKRRVRASG